MNGLLIAAAALTAFGIMVVFATGIPAQSTPTIANPCGFLIQTVTLNETTYRFCLYVPAQYDPNKTWPLILALHGSGERGDDGLLQTDVGIGTAIRRHADRFPCLVLMPQCRPTQAWIDPTMSAMTIAALQHVIERQKIDTHRIYLTGLSLGGQGAWHLGARYPDHFAAIVPVCGFGPTDNADNIAQTPVWCFHGARDNVVPASETRKMVAAIRQHTDNVRYTEYADGSHNVWDRAYNDPDLWRWVLQQRRSSPARFQ